MRTVHDAKWPLHVKLFVLATLVLASLMMLYLIRPLLPPLGAALLLASILRVPVNYLERRTGLPRSLLTLFTFLAVGVLVALAPVLIVPPIIASIAELRLNLTDAINALQAWAAQPVVLGPGIAVVPLRVLGPTLDSIRNMLTPLAGSVVSLAGRLATSITWGIFVMVVTFWLVKDYPLFLRHLRALLPPHYQDELTRLGREIASTWDAFLKGQFTLALIIGTLLSIVLWVLGMPSPIALGLFSGFMEFIPTLGPLFAWLLAVTLALLRGSSWLPVSPVIFALIITVVYLLFFQLDSVFFIPRIVGRRVRLHPLVVFIGLIAGAMLAGVIGVLLAAPVLATGRVILRYVYNKLLDFPPFPPEEPLLTPERGWWQPERARQVRLILFDLDGTLFETDNLLVARLAQVLRPVANLLESDPHRIARRLTMSLEGFLNNLITILNLLRLDRPAFWLTVRLDRWLYGGRVARTARLTPHVRALLTDLQEHYILGVVTTRSRQETEALLSAAGIRDFFRVIVTRDDVRRLKPHPEPIRLAAARAGVSPEQTLVVGDTPVDIRAAKAAGALAAGVLCGFGELEELQEADIILNVPAELWRWLTDTHPSLTTTHPSMP